VCTYTILISNVEMRNRDKLSNLGYDRDPEILKLAQETRRLSMEASNGTKRPTPDRTDRLYRPRQSTTPDSTGRRSSESSSHNGSVNGSGSGGSGGRKEITEPLANRKKSQTPPNRFSRKTSESLGLSNGSASNSRRGSTSSNSKQDVDRRPSSDLNSEELTARRMSEAGLRRPSAASDEILNENTGNLMVGMPVWVDGTKHGRIAYIGEVHFAKGEMAGVHLDTSQGKNNGTVGGVMYFQCEPRRGLFSRLHRLTLRPLSGGY